jgi:hypothetical protein
MSFLVAFPVSAEGVDLRNGKSELEKQINEGSYEVQKQQDVVAGVRINIWGGSAFFGYGAMSNSTGGGQAATIKCNPSSNDSFSLTGTIVSPADLWTQLDKGSKPSIKIRWQIGAVNGDAEVLQKACSERYSEFTKTTETTVKDSETVENTIKLDAGDAAVEEALGQKLLGALRSSLLKDFDKSSWFKDLSSDDKLKAGCTYDPVDKKYACNAAAKERLFQRMLGTCARAALADKTGDQKTMIADCVSTNMYGDTSKAKTIASNMKSITVDDLKKIAEEAREKAIDELTKEEESEENTKTCGTEVTGIGWIICPITNAAIGFADTIWSIFEGMLRTSPLRQSGGSDNGMYFETWQNIRNIANVLFIIVFLLVVFSQVSNIGLSNYGIKKMLPRMIMAALAINLSFFIVQIAVDIANVLGSTILDVFENAIVVKPEIKWENVLSDIVGGAAVGTLTVFGVGFATAAGLTMPLIILLVLLLIPAVVGLVAGFLTLVIRSALIPIIAIFAPLAFVAYIFPNGQSLFDKWRKTFTALLLLYPLSAIYFGALKFVAAIMINAQGVLERMVGHGLLFMGCFVVLGIALKGNAITGKVFGSIQGGINKVVEPARKVGMGVAGGMAALRFAKFKNTNPSSINAGKAGFLGRHAVTRGVGRVLRTFDQSKWAREQGVAVAKGDQQQAFQEWATGDGKDKFTKISGIDAGSSLTGKAYMNTLTEKAVKNQEARINSMDISQLAKEFKEAVNANNGQGDEIRALAAQNRLLESGALGLTMANDVLASTNGGGQLYGSLASNVRSNHAGAMAQDNVTKAWAGKSNSEDQSWQAATARAQEKIVKDGITPEKFATLSDEAQARILSDSSTRARLSNEALKALGDSSSIFGGKVSDKNRDVINVELSARGVSVAGAAPAAGGSPASVPGGAGFNQQTQSGLWIPRNGSGGQAPPPPNNQPPAPPSTP